MASAGVREELECSVCLNTFTDPVNLTCGHNFCRGCIDRVLDRQEGSKSYSCPVCREKFERRPALYRNIALRKILDNILSTDQEETRILCTYCVDSPVPAVKSCLLCEASLCEKHLRVHSRSAEHVLCDPTTTLENRKCSVHKKALEYYCTEDSACICVLCMFDRTHHGHRVEKMEKAFENRKRKLKSVLEKMLAMREETVQRVRSLKNHQRKSNEKAELEREKVTALFRDLRRRLEDLEKRVLGEVSRQAERHSRSFNDLIHQLETRKDELSKKMRHIEKLCNVTDPLKVLQESDRGDLCDAKNGNHKQTCDQQHQGDLDFAQVSRTLHKGLSNIITKVRKVMPTSTPPAMSSASPRKNWTKILDGHTGDIFGKLMGACSMEHPDPFQLYSPTVMETPWFMQPWQEVEAGKPSSEESRGGIFRSLQRKVAVEEESEEEDSEEEESEEEDSEEEEEFENAEKEESVNAEEEESVNAEEEESENSEEEEESQEEDEEEESENSEEEEDSEEEDSSDES